MVITGRLENWSYDPTWKIFWGEIHEDVHGRWADGTRIHTSACPFPLAEEGDIVNTLNSKYRLGKPYIEQKV